MTSTPVRALGRVVVGAAAAVAIVGIAIALFLNPLWLGFEQGRSDASAWTGWTGEQVGDVTGAVLRDLIVGPPDFAMAVDGRPVFNERERDHLRDVRGAFLGFGVAVLAAILVLVATRLASKRADWFWRGIGGGAAALADAVVLAGLVFALASDSAFDSAFDIMHRLFFAGGTYTFDPASERLVQLFPERFWYETSLAFGLSLVALSLLVVRFALARARR